jgi:acylaminoacyl-peptidase
MALGLKVLKLGAQGAEAETIIDIVQEKHLNVDFAGITGFVDILSRTEWLNDRFLVLNTYSGCSLGIFIVDIETKEIKRIDQPKFKSEEWRFKNIHDGLIVSTVSNMDGGSRIAIYSGLNLKASSLEEALRDAKWSNYELKFSGFDGAVLTDIEKENNIHEKIIEIDGVQSLFFGVHDPSNHQDLRGANSKRPLVVFLHGGPHAVYTGISTVTRQYLVKKGYNLLMPCFTGSMGYGAKFMEDLAGKIGEIDVEEIIKSIEYCGKEGLCDESKVAMFGGSYGGYLCAALAGKHSEKFKCAIILNPALNAVHSWETSDIPEWAPGEALNKDTVFDINSEEIKKMYDMSPISWYKDKDVKTSILLMLGEKDRRVFWGAGLQYYNMLRKKGTDIRLLTYPEGEHSLLGNPEMEFDVFIQTINFIDEKLSN